MMTKRNPYMPTPMTQAEVTTRQAAIAAEMLAERRAFLATCTDPAIRADIERQIRSLAATE